VELSRRLCYWKQHSSVPCFTGSVAGYMNKECSCDYLVSLNDRIQTKLNTLDSTNTSECISALLHLLGEHGLQHLLGMRHTLGSVWILYPPREYLIQLFEQKHNPKAQLTVGARALSKHSRRCKGNWGEYA